MERSLLVVFSIITIFLQAVAGNSFDFLRAVAQAETEEQQFDDLEQNNMISDYGNKYTPMNKKRKAWVKVELSGSLQSHVLSKGQSYELTCKVEGGPAPQIRWLGGGNVPEQVEELKKLSVAYEPSIFMNSGATKMEMKYVIDCASKRHEGPLHCMAIAGDTAKWESTVILVSDNVNSTQRGYCGSTRPPVITHHATTLIALQGTSVILPCVAKGKPKPYITWETSDGSLITNHLFNSRYIVLDSGDLLIDSLEWDDMNVYTCVARSKLGEDRASTFIYPAQRDDRR